MTEPTCFDRRGDSFPNIVTAKAPAIAAPLLTINSAIKDLY